MTTPLLSQLDTLLDPAIMIDCRTFGQTLDDIYASPEMAKPPIRAATEFFIQQIISDCPAPLYQAAMALAEAAETSGVANGYHNPAHSFQVMVNAMALIQVNQYQAINHAAPQQFLNDKEIMTILLAAIAHDLDHDGTTNMNAEGQRVPFRLETIAVARADAIMRRADVAQDIRQDVTALIHGTDVGEKNGLKLIAKQQAAAGAPDLSEIPVQLQPLVGQPRLLAMAQIICDADLLSSAGLTRHSMENTTVNLGIEWHKPLTLAQLNGFLTYVVGDSFQSQAGKFFNANLSVLRQTVEYGLSPPQAHIRKTVMAKTVAAAHPAP